MVLRRKLTSFSFSKQVGALKLSVSAVHVVMG